MQIVIDQTDFRRLSADTQSEIMQVMSGQGARTPSVRRSRDHMDLKWREPVDLTTEQAAKLVHGLAEDYRKRLALFARKDGRVRMKEIMAVGGDTDLRAASDFQKAITRRLRRLIDDPEKKGQLIFWDFDATKWDSTKTMIVDGVYYVSPATARALRAVL